MKPWLEENIKALKRIGGAAVAGLCLFLVILIWMKLLQALIVACKSSPEQMAFTEKYVLQSMELLKSGFWPAVALAFLIIFREQIAVKILQMKGFNFFGEHFSVNFIEEEQTPDAAPKSEDKTERPPVTAIPPTPKFDNLVASFTKDVLVSRGARIEAILRKYGTHSFQWFRDFAGLAWTDEEFEEAVAANPNLKPARIRGGGPNGRPGVRLRPEAK